MVTSLRRSEERLGRISCRIERCEAASQSGGTQSAIAPCVSSRQHVPKCTSCCSACIYPAAVPAHQCSRHPSTSRWCTMRAWQALAGGSSARVTHAVGTRGAVGATPRQLDVPRSADIICKVCLQDLVCPDVCLQDLSDRESCRNSTGVCPDVCPEKPRLRRECARRGGVPSGPKLR